MINRRNIFKLLAAAPFVRPEKLVAQPKIEPIEFLVAYGVLTNINGEWVHRVITKEEYMKMAPQKQDPNLSVFIESSRQ